VTNEIGERTRERSCNVKIVKGCSARALSIPFKPACNFAVISVITSGN